MAGRTNDSNERADDLGGQQPQDPRQRLVLVDVDTGTDDALALMMLAAADAVGEIRLLGVTCVGGNTALGNVCRNTLRMLRAANRLDIPVFAGAEMPLVAERPIRSTFHGLDGFGDLDHSNFPGDDGELDGLVQRENAVVAMNRIVSEHKGEVTLVCLAPLTNIALAVRTYPDFRKSLRDVHIMGGNIKGLGNTTPAAEFNFAMDPEAAHVVLESVECPVQVTPWEPCLEHPIPMDWRLSTLSSLGGGPPPLPASRGGLAMRLMTAAEVAIRSRPSLAGPDPDSKNSSSSSSGSSVSTALFKASWICCDQLAVAALLRPDRVVRRAFSRHVTVELAGSRTRGQMVPACVVYGGECDKDCRRGSESGGGGEAGAAGAAGAGARLNAGAPPPRILEAFDMEEFKELLLWSAERWTRVEGC